MATQNLRLIESSRGLSRIITQSGLGTDLQSVDRRGSGSFAVPARLPARRRSGRSPVSGRAVSPLSCGFVAVPPPVRILRLRAQ